MIGGANPSAMALENARELMKANPVSNKKASQISFKVITASLSRLKGIQEGF